jgi:hypothetical protein
MYTLALATILASFHPLLTAPTLLFALRDAIAVPNDLALRQRFLQCHDALATAWEAAAAEVLKGELEPLGAMQEQFLILVTCRDEKQRVELLGAV